MLLRALSFCERISSTIYTVDVSSLLAAGHANRPAEVSASTPRAKVIHHQFIKVLIVLSNTFQ